MKTIIGVQFNNREDAERMFMDEHPDMELGMTGRIIWLMVMIIFYAIAGIPYLILNMILTAYSQFVTLFLFATNPLVLKKDLTDKEEPS